MIATAVADLLRVPAAVTAVLLELKGRALAEQARAAADEARAQLDEIPEAEPTP